ncbi:tRNA-(ms[2]io[6]A)-hydroxylase [Orbus hercynius]|uniref:tRNA-(Ms[2]io[6]A)-hydroxylase n=1 Tax=Orbus hercynius TaxID=593135 RepID=A0A495RD32_9GAMM|nr:tRNA isopentenyl-2-thiomethyl-A-37 hydroxylase MiaE [Orbus hercynius]RKS85134.1 tRNA-(ms[2]io[6]A)-hydroxylase [Orbus hercynius]
MTLSAYQSLLVPINDFLQCETPDSWINEASKAENLSMLLIDHMICELKAAQTAAWLIRKYAVDKPSGDVLLNWLAPYENLIYRQEGSLTELLASHHDISKKLTLRANCAYSHELVDKMVMLIKEELHHFCQVLSIMEQRQIAYQNISAGRYAKKLMQQVRTHEPATLVDKLICGAYIEARSCERFAKLSAYVDDELACFYISLLRSESRHYQDYLKLAQHISDTDISERVSTIGLVEAELIDSTDNEFRFHSGVPLK